MPNEGVKLKFVLLFSLFFCLKGFSFEVYFSPETNLDQIVVQEIQKSKKNIDISIYTFRSTPIIQALVDKVKNNSNFKIRILIRRADMESLVELFLPLEAEFEKLGVNTENIKYVNVTNHHKFLIVDGKTLLNTSGNFNDSPLQASYDENLFVCSRSCPELVEAFQTEFEYLYFNSHPLFIDDLIPSNSDHLGLLYLKPDAKDFKSVALFTSDNFFIETVDGKNKFKIKKNLNIGIIENKLISTILNAKKSIKVATGHLRSWTLAKTLAEAAKKGIQVEVILDGQEYLSPEYQILEDQMRDKCLKSGKSLEDCYSTGFRFGRWLETQGVKVSFKYYMIFWDFIDAPQMHHKYMIVDNQVVFTGSYNWSKNAEFKTFENLAILNNKKVVTQFLKNFEAIKNYGVKNFKILTESWIQNKSDVNLIFDPMTLTVPEIDKLFLILKKNHPEVFINKD